MGLRTLRQIRGSSSRGRVPSGTSGYFEGYPGDASSPVEANVAFQVLCDEASGNIADEVAALALTLTGTPTFSVTASGLFAGWSPGITYGDGGTQKHLNSSPGSQVELGSGSGTIEFGYSFVNMTGNRFMLALHDNSVGGIFVRMNSATPSLIVTILADDASTTVTATKTLPATWNDTNPHKIRIVIDRVSEIMTLYFDGVSIGTELLDAITGLGIAGPNICIGNYASGNNGCGCTIWYVRISKNATNNCGGPGGG